MMYEKLRTATVTWITYENFGTYLQAYALQQVLISLGYENHIIDDRIFVSPKPIRKFLSRLKRKLFNQPVVPSVSPYYRRFRNKYLQIEKRWKHLSSLGKSYDAFICGSDQIWSPYCIVNPFYYLGFTDKLKIAYAPSTGTGKLPSTYIEQVRPLLESFAALSVREESGAAALSACLGKHVEAVLDPTLLLPATKWQKIITPAKAAEPEYILCYFLTPNKWYMDYAQKEAERKKLPLKIFYTHPAYKKYGNEQLVTGPDAFISYIARAKKIYTDSYHASIFSILFHKDFVTFKRFQDGGNNDQNARIVDLFRKIGLERYFLGQEELKEEASFPIPDYVSVEEKLNPLRNASIHFLSSALKGK